MNPYFLAISLTLLLSACGEIEEPTFDREYYKSHESERLAKLEWCDGNAERKETFNCKNALSAQAQINTALMLGEGIPRPQREK